MSKDDTSVKPLDSYKSIFLPFKKKPPTILEALIEMGIDAKDAEEMTGFAHEKVLQVRKDHNFPLTDDEMSAIYMYTSSLFDSEKSPYELVNEALSSLNKDTEIQKVKMYLALLLSGIRKLPRTFPTLYILYRGIDVAVPIPKKNEGSSSGLGDADSGSTAVDIGRGRAPVTPYANGEEKTWWSFTSTTGTLNRAKYFTKRHEKKGVGKASMMPGIGQPAQQQQQPEKERGTLFIITTAWGYDISVFSEHPDEKEFLLEPERKMNVEGVLDMPDGLTITLKFNVDAKLPLEDVFPPKYTKAVPQEVPEKAEMPTPEEINLMGLWCNGAALSWDPVNVEGVEAENVVYQVGVQKKKLFKSGPIEVIGTTKEVPTEDKPLHIGELLPGTKYSAMVRVATPEFKSKWSKAQVTFITPAIERVESIEATNTSVDKIMVRWPDINSSPGYHIFYEVQTRPAADPKAEFAIASTDDRPIFIQKTDDDDDDDATSKERLEIRVRGVIRGTDEAGPWSDSIYAGPLNDFPVTGTTCEYVPEENIIKISWDPVKTPANGGGGGGSNSSGPVSYTVICHNTFKLIPIYTGRATSCVFRDFDYGAQYGFYVKARRGQMWNKQVKKPNAVINTPLATPFPGAWRAHLNNSGVDNYVLEEGAPTVARANIVDSSGLAIVTGNTWIPSSQVSWNIKIRALTGSIPIFGIAPVSIRYVYSSLNYFRFGWLANIVTGEVVFGKESRYPSKNSGSRIPMMCYQFTGTRSLNVGDVITVTFNNAAKSISYSYNGVPINNGNPVYANIDTNVGMVPVVIMFTNGTEIELIQ